MSRKTHLLTPHLFPQKTHLLMFTLFFSFFWTEEQTDRWTEGSCGGVLLHYRGQWVEPSLLLLHYLTDPLFTSIFIFLLSRKITGCFKQKWFFSWKTFSCNVCVFFFLHASVCCTKCMWVVGRAMVGSGSAAPGQRSCVLNAVWLWLYRWFQLLRADKSKLENQMQMLQPDFSG